MDDGRDGRREGVREGRRQSNHIQASSRSSPPFAGSSLFFFDGKRCPFFTYLTTAVYKSSKSSFTDRLIESGGEASEGKGERGPEPPARQASYYAALMEEAAWELEGREGEGIVSTMDGEMAPEDDKGVVHQSSLSAPSLVAEVTDEEGVGNS
ncbi:hypothetical protein NSK_003746 [Nannochloropsis salina CCMP1776]|uniref:Uncharacterized protein n=1 Tax=Nannochloropsis salina CCMP1776 TaxID=1027361 RepID=A0A4D9D5S1_9STRA|nr:hypothetical protein NSK_003746 [Nannochloropsis salina CCMP1776]|eukprot:TFJ85323.1 hypothetical protein NSK_003746 [Nannochloropsis salina CCMP1776]